MEFVEQANYLPRLESIFDELKEKLQMVLPNSRIEHVGSSSIPGAISKGDLDIFLGVNQVDFSKAIKMTETIGFREKTDTQRTKSLCMMVTDFYIEDVAIQIVANNTEFESFIEFRDRLRKNPELVTTYNKLKLDCKGMPHEQYREIKSSFIESVLNAI